MPMSDMFRFRGSTSVPKTEDARQNSLYTQIEPSEAIASLIKYVEENQNKDLLVTGFDEELANNPLRRERAVKCIVI